MQEKSYSISYELINLKIYTDESEGELQMNVRKIYRQIARKNGVTVKEVRNEMQGAILAAYQNPSKNNSVTDAYQRKIPCRRKIPTPEELIRFATGEIQKSRCGYNK